MRDDLSSSDRLLVGEPAPSLLPGDALLRAYTNYHVFRVGIVWYRKLWNYPIVQGVKDVLIVKYR